jgi:hypothetical protein
MRVVFLIAVALFLMGCDEFPETHYATASDAMQDGAFEHGWLPAVLLPDVMDIHEAHTIDSNRRGVGQFALNTALLGRLRATCKPATANPVSPPYIPERWGPYADGQRLRTLPVVRCESFFVATDLENRLGYFWTPSKLPT